MPYFWSDLADWATLEYVGVGIGSGEPVVRGSLDDGDFTAFYLDGERVVGAATVGRAEDLDHARRLIRSRATPGRDALADEGTGPGGALERPAARRARPGLPKLSVWLWQFGHSRARLSAVVFWRRCGGGAAATAAGLVLDPHPSQPRV